MITQTFKLNLIPDSAPIVVNCDQYDKGTGRLIIELYEDDIAYTPTGTAIIQGTKPDGHGFAYAATLAGNVVTADLTEQMTAVAGRVRCQVVVTETSGRTGTFVFMLDVQRSALPADSDMSDSDYQIVEQAILNAEGWAVGEHGGVPVGPDDPTYHNNAKYWADMASQYATGGIVFKGSCAFASIPTTGMNNGDMWNITDDFTTDSRFVEGSGIPCVAGTNIVWEDTISKWDIFSTMKIGSINDLNDVSITTPTDGQALIYDANSGEWINGAGGGGAADLDDLTDVDITSITGGQVLKYNATTTKWENTFEDYLNTNLQTLDEFVLNTDNWNYGHNYGRNFKIKDVNNVFGLGANSWLKGFVIYQNRYDDAYGNVGGTGLVYISNSGQPYNFYIYGDGSVGDPYTLQVKTVTVDIDELDDLKNVTITTPTDGQALIYDSNTQKWKNGAGGGGSSTLAGLSDVTITSASEGEALTYDSNSSDWVNTDLFDSFEGLHGVTEITSATSDINNYTTEGNYYKAAVDFAMTNGPYNNTTTRMFMTVKTVKDSNGVVRVIWQDAIVKTDNAISMPRHYFRARYYNENTSTWSWSSWDHVTPYSLFATLNNDVYAIKTSYQALFGTTEITSSNADLNTYTSVGNYYKSATNFSLSHTPSSNATARCFLSVTKLYDTCDDIIEQKILIQSQSGSSTIREWYRTALKSGGTWVFTNWFRSATSAALEQQAGFWSPTVSCLVGDTTATFTDTNYDSSWTFDAYCDDGTGEPIAISKIEVNASNQAVVTFASALVNATSVKLHYWK